MIGNYTDFGTGSRFKINLFARVFLRLRFILNLPRTQKYRHDERYLTVNLFMRTNFVTQLSNLAR